MCDRVEILQLMFNQNINFFIALPSDGQKQDYINRASERGNNPTFLKVFENSYDKWWNAMNSIPVKKIYLEKDEYVEDALIRLNLFNPKRLISL